MSTLAVPAIGKHCAGLSDHPDSAEVSRLLGEMKAHAGQLNEDASDLVSLSRKVSGHEDYVLAVVRIKEHLEAAGQSKSALDRLRSEASSAQRRTMDRVTPLVCRVAGETARLISSLDESPRRMRSGEYRDLIDSNSDMASQFAALIAAFVDFGGGPRRTRSTSGTS
jgi:hypothetical protein